MSKSKATSIERLKEFINEYRRYKIGIAGLILLFFLVFLAVFAPVLAPREKYDNWYNLAYWKENPSGVPPVWVNLFSSQKLPPHKTISIDSSEAEFTESGGTYKYTTNVTYNFKYDVPPNDIIIRILGKTYEGRNGSLSLKIIRPDGYEIKLYSSSTVFPEEYDGRPCKTIVFSKNREIGRNIIKWASQFENETNLRTISGRPEVGRWTIYALFSKAEAGILVGKAPMLRGEYSLVISATFYSDADEFYGIKVIIAGATFGLAGTDIYGRDLFAGIVWGARLALIIGILTSVVSTFIGVFYGVASGYAGGLTDEFMQRIYEIVASIPLLPILLILSWKFGATIWNLALIMTLFYWVGPVKTVRSMALQIKEQTYVEAAKAVGVPTRRIIMKYVANQVIPYAFAVMALSVPGAILTEAGISFLLGGRGVREPTWGKILHDAHAAAATMKGMWWWVLLPGVMICIAGLAFIMIGNALDRILNPTLRR